MWRNYVWLAERIQEEPGIAERRTYMKTCRHEKERNMAYGVNKVALLGYVAADPTIHTFDNGGTIARVRIGVSETWRTRDGESRECTEWVNVVFYNGIADVVRAHVRKGERVYVEGKFTTRSWDAADGSLQYITEVAVRSGTGGGTLVMLSGRQVDRAAPPVDDNADAEYEVTHAVASHLVYTPMGQYDDDEIPF